MGDRGRGQFTYSPPSPGFLPNWINGRESSRVTDNPPAGNWELAAFPAAQAMVEGSLLVPTGGSLKSEHS